MTQKTEVQKRAEEARAYLKGKGVSDTDLKALKDEDAIAKADAKRTEEQATADAAAAEKAKQPITRGEVADMLKANNEALKTELLPQVGVSVRDALKDIFAPTTQRKDGEQTPEEKAAAEQKAKEGVDLGKSIGEAMRSAMEPLVTQVAEQGKALKAVTDTVEKIAGATTVRSDGGDGKQTTTTTAQRKDVFKGMFGGKKQEQQAAS